jgi:hypothetical protein
MANGHNKNQWYRTTTGSRVMISSMCMVGEQESKDVPCYLSLRVRAAVRRPCYRESYLYYVVTNNRCADSSEPTILSPHVYHSDTVASGTARNPSSGLSKTQQLRNRQSDGYAYTSSDSAITTRDIETPLMRSPVRELSLLPARK